MLEAIFYKVKEVRIGLGLTEAFLQKLHHKYGYGVLEDIEENVLIDHGPFELSDALEVLKLVVIHDEVEDGGGLEEVGFAGPLTGACANTIDEIALDAEEFGIYGDNETCFAIFDSFEDYSFRFVKLHL